MTTLEVWADFACPWCYLGKRRLERAIEQRPDVAVEVSWRAFQLDPDTPRYGQPGAGELTDRYLESKFGDVERLREAQARLTELAAADGLAYQLDIARHVNTLDAHRLVREADASGDADALVEALFRAQLEEGRRIDDPLTLRELAADAGIDRDAVTRVLETDEHLDQVQGDVRTAHELGVTGVPFFAIDRRFGVSGAQPIETLAAAIDRAAGDPAPAP